jgi:hypothetical protein
MLVLGISLANPSDALLRTPGFEVSGFKFTVCFRKRIKRCLNVYVNISCMSQCLPRMLPSDKSKARGLSHSLNLPSAVALFRITLCN